MKNTTKQKRKNRSTPHVKNGKIIGHRGYGQQNKMISTLRRMMQFDVKNKED